MPPTDPHTIGPDHQLPEHSKTSEKQVGPTVGIFIIILLMIIGGIYFWGEHLNRLHNVAPLPLIPAGNPTD